MKLIKSLKSKRDDYNFSRMRNILNEDYGNPVFIVGMHRSGTSVFARLLQMSGAYFGHYLDKNHEPYGVIRINDILLKKLGYSWHDLTEIDWSSETLQTLSRVLLWQRHTLWNGYFKNFGDAPKEAVEHDVYKRQPWQNKFILNWQRNPQKTPFWGIKDPRVTLLLPVWKELFPGAKIIHIYRDGVDVALSLWRRANKNNTGGDECKSQTHCFKLWERHFENAREWAKKWPGDYFEIKYEDLVKQPYKTLESCRSFLGSLFEIPEAVNEFTDPSCAQRETLEEHENLKQLALTSRIYRELGYAAERYGQRDSLGVES